MKGLWLVRKPLQAEIYGRTTIVQHLVRQIDAYSPVFHTPLKFLPLAIWGGVCLRPRGGQLPSADTDGSADTLKSWIWKKGPLLLPDQLQMTAWLQQWSLNLVPTFRPQDRRSILQ